MWRFLHPVFDFIDEPFFARFGQFSKRLSDFTIKYQLFPIVNAVDYQRTVHGMTSVCMRLCSKIVLCSVTEHSMTPFRFQTAQNPLSFVLFSGMAVLKLK